MCCKYVIKPSFLNFVRFSQAAKIINKNVDKYFIYYLYAIAITAIVYLIAILLGTLLTKIGYTGLILYCIFVSLIWTYHLYILAGLFSSAVKLEDLNQ